MRPRRVVALHVATEQEQVVGSVRRALADAAEYPQTKPWYRAVYAGDEPVGFVRISGWSLASGKATGSWSAGLDQVRPGQELS
jgi:hypothetical protein